MQNVIYKLSLFKSYDYYWYKNRDDQDAVIKDVIGMIFPSFEVVVLFFLLFLMPAHQITCYTGVMIKMLFLFV
jgi:hypothetical protein